MANETLTATTLETDHYAVLGVASDATPEAIRRAYRDQAQDAMMNDRPRFEALTAAFDTLKDAERRTEYDRARATANRTQGFAAAPNATRAMPPSPTVSASTALTVTKGAPQTASGGGDANRTQGFQLLPCPICQTQSAPGEEFCLECGFLLGSAVGAPMGAARPLPRLVDAGGREFALRVGENTVGREGADIALPDKTVSRRHARVVVEETGAVWVEDMGSANGSKHAGQPLSPGQKASLADGARLQFGSMKLTVSIPFAPNAQRALAAAPVSTAKPVAALAAPQGQASDARLKGANGAVHVLAHAVTTVGRKPTNLLVLSGDSFVSGSHAEIRFEAGKFVLLDVNSTNGTKWNGRKVAAGVPQVLSDGDEIVFGQTPWTFHAPGGAG